MRKVLLAVLAVATAGCAKVNYSEVKKGTFTGEVAVVWLKGTEGPGDGTFVYVPTKGNPLTFTRPDGKTEIEPTMIYTDGGSVPSLARAFRGLTPWNYAPAYIVHDWLFRAKQCWASGKKRDDYKVAENMDFPTSATIIAESIKALHDSGRVRPSDTSGALITAAVSSPISERLWNKTDTCIEVSDKDRKLAEQAVGRRAMVGRTYGVLVYRDAEGDRVQDDAAVVVGVTTFD
ncbi:MAG: hypothetical protein V4720_03925 [Pseudomonadota bacterium]